MATYNRPGVYVNELPLAAAPVSTAAAATAAGAVIASLPQGPDTVTLVTSWYDFTKKFGGYDKAYPATFSIGSFFANGGTELFVKRVLPTSAKKVAKVTVPAAPVQHAVAATSYSITSNVVSLTATGHGITDSSQSITLSGFSSGNAFLNGTYTITGYDTNTVTFSLTHANTSGSVTASGSLAYSTVPTATYATFAAKHRGIDGNNIRVKISNSKVVRESGYYDVSVFYEAGVADTVSGGIVTANAGDDVLVEQFNGVVFDDPTSGDYIVSVLEFGSAYVRVLSGAVVEYNTDGSLVSPEATYTVGSAGTPSVDVIYALSGAADPQLPLTYADYTGDSVFNPATSTGSFAVDNCSVFTEFEVIDRPLIFFVPDVTAKIATTSDPNTAVLGGWGLAKYVFNALVSWVEADKTQGRHFVVVETDAGLTVDLALQASGDIVPNSSRAAVYYPHIYIKDPVGRSGASVRNIGPSGAVTGLYLATDNRVGPFKAAAGIDAKVSDALAIERAFSSSDLDALNSGVATSGATSGRNVVNAIRNVPGAGVVVMGARTLLQDGTANRYINMRRSLTYLEKRLNDLASFAVFENNDEKLWARLITILGSFLNDYRNQGGLRGTTIDQSYYIKCDLENNTPTTIAAGEVHVEIGVALEYPAEFVVINLSQKTAE
jgi:Phage tail sheath C-terminal domain